MNNVNQFLLNTNRSLTSYEQDTTSSKKYVNADQFGATEKFNDLWNAAHIELQERYSLPSFHLWESGFVQGDATDDEVFEAKDSINKFKGLEDIENISATLIFPTVNAEWDEDEIETNIYLFLDFELLKILEPKVEILIEEYINFCKSVIDEG